MTTINDLLKGCDKLVGQEHTKLQIDNAYGNPKLKINDMLGYALEVEQGQINVLYRRIEDNRYRVFDTWFIPKEEGE